MARGPFRRSFYERGIPEAIAFDTHRFVKRLKEGGFTEQQAEEQAAVLNATLAAKAGMAQIRSEIARIEAGMESLRQETMAGLARNEAGMEAVKADLLKWLFGAMIAQGGLVVALVKLHVAAGSPARDARRCGEHAGRVRRHAHRGHPRGIRPASLRRVSGHGGRDRDRDNGRRLIRRSDGAGPGFPHDGGSGRRRTGTTDRAAARRTMSGPPCPPAGTRPPL